MADLKVSLTERKGRTIYGLWKKSNDRTASTDVPSLSKAYYSAISQTDGSVLPFFVLSKDYDQQTKAFQLFIGGTLEKGGLESFALPGGEYAQITVQPKLGFLWGMAIGEAKRYFYTKWLPNSPYQPRNMEYEFHTEKSIGKHPEIEIMFAIKRKAQ